VNLGKLWPELHARIRAYDFEWVEQYLGTPIPSALKDIYLNSEVLDLENNHRMPGVTNFCGLEPKAGSTLHRPPTFLAAV